MTNDLRIVAISLHQTHDRFIQRGERGTIVKWARLGGAHRVRWDNQDGTHLCWPKNLRPLRYLELLAECADA